jgi:dihydropteroate synthase-like protein
MKVLAVTGRLAQDLVKASADGADVLVLDVDIAAFITPQMLLQAAPKGYDLILIPGAATADFREAEDTLGTKIRLGPKHAADLGFVLSHLGNVELSTSIPACVLLESRMRKDALSTIVTLEDKAEPAMTIKGIKIGGSSRMKVLAEVVDATRMNEAALDRMIVYYQSQGADMIDLGVSLDATSDQVSRTVKAAKKATSLPVSIDTVQSDLILAGIEAGADFVLSLNGENINLIGEALARKGVPAVVIPGPKQSSLDENMKAAEASGIQIIADPVLSPPLQGLATSIKGYTDFRRSNSDTPLFFGIGNITELLDADCIGVNAILAALGSELGASILFTPEYSPKTKGSIRELKTASEMMLLADHCQSPPKDLGIDLLVLKEKRHRPEERVSTNWTPSKIDHAYEMDPAGSFRIHIADEKIVASHPKIEVVGTSAKDILNTLIDLGLVTRLDHAGYLGRELEKAEMALRLNRSYCQDEHSFPDKG